MIRIEDTRVYGLDESIVASGLPFSFTPSAKEERALKLAQCKHGTGHDNWLCGVIVQCTITAPRYWWPEAQRYHHVDIVSATSTMHMLKAFVERCHACSDADERGRLIAAHFDPATEPTMIDGFLSMAYGCDDIGRIKANLPEGFLQKARITTNYRQLKTMYLQRCSHQLDEWRDMCKWIRGLPMMAEMLG